MNFSPWGCGNSEGVLAHQARSIGHSAILSMLGKSDGWQAWAGEFSLQIDFPVSSAPRYIPRPSARLPQEEQLRSACFENSAARMKHVFRPHHHH
jgi:hypothetical protein